MTALESALEVGPWRQRRRRTREAGNQRTLGEVQRFRRAIEQMSRHRFDTVDAAAEVDAIQIQLEDLLLGERRVDHDGERRLADLASVGLLIRQEQRARELLSQCAATLYSSSRSHIPVHRAAQ